jgi:hypothetical protein
MPGHEKNPNLKTFRRATRLLESRDEPGPQEDQLEIRSPRGMTQIWLQETKQTFQAIEDLVAHRRRRHALFPIIPCIPPIHPRHE